LLSCSSGITTHVIPIFVVTVVISPVLIPIPTVLPWEFHVILPLPFPLLLSDGGKLDNKISPDLSVGLVGIIWLCARGLTHQAPFWNWPGVLEDKALVLATLAHHRASFLTVSAQHSGDWLCALPIASCDLKVDDEAVRVAVGLRLGA